MSMENKVNHPKHYNAGKIECIDAMLSAFSKQEVMSFCKLNAFKYIWRADLKNGEEDISKALWYLNKLNELSNDKNTEEKNKEKEYIKTLKYFCENMTPYNKIAFSLRNNYDKNRTCSICDENITKATK